MDPHKKANLFKSMTGEHLYLLVEMEQHQLHLFLKKILNVASPAKYL